MTTEVEKLVAILKERGIRIGGITLGPNATPETVAAEISRTILAIENGEAEEVIDFDDAASSLVKYVTKLDIDKAKIAEFQSRAKAINDSTLEMRKQLGRDLMAYAEDHLREYSYGDGGIESAIQDVVQTAKLDDWELRIDFWLPSNFGC